MKRIIPTILLLAVLLAACAPVDLNAPLPAFDTGVDPNAWAQIPAGEFLYGQHEHPETTGAYAIMLTDATTGEKQAVTGAALSSLHVSVPSAPGSALLIYERASVR